MPLYWLQNTCNRGQYRIEKTVFAHHRQHAVIQIIRFIPSSGDHAAYRLYALLAPHLDNHGRDNSAWLGEHKGVPMLFAQRGSYAPGARLVGSLAPGSVGYVGVSDGARELAEKKTLTQEYDRAEKGNVMLTGEVDYSACGGTFMLVVGFVLGLPKPAIERSPA